MFVRIREFLARLRGNYPGQFWLMFWGMLISTLGSSMVWPFLMIYATRHLNLPVSTAASLMTINASVALLSSFIAGPVADRVGRKWMMAISLIGMGGVYLFYTQAGSYGALAVLMALSGLFNPLYRVAADAMMADLIPPQKRPDAYALLRMANNLGIAVGPAIGGFLAVTSYNYAFLGAAAGMSSYAVLISLFARETLPEEAVQARHAAPGTAASEARQQPLGGYRKIFADRQFVSFIVAFTLNQFCAALVWVLLGVHVARFGVRENEYGLIPMTNAIMVVVFQALVTSQTRRRPPLPVLALGSFFYMAAATSVAFGQGFWAFWLSMVVMTTGELILMPTSTTYVAGLAPADMRGRYMSIYALTWGVAQGIAPLAGGFLADNIGPSAPWFFGGVAGLLAVTAFARLAIRYRSRARELAAGD